MELSLITNEPAFAALAEQAGVQRVLIDLERLGKATRQAGRGLFLSSHSLDDVPRVRQALRQAKLMVRVDPLHSGSREQIDAVIDAGADFVMLPYFHLRDQARQFVEFVSGRAATVLLVETWEAATTLANLCRLPGVNEIHLGLNDLSLSLGRRFLFDVIAEGVVDRLCHTLRESGLPFGFGGIGSLSRRDLPVDPELILAEQVCQGASRGWLGRTFRDTAPPRLADEIVQLRHAISHWRQSTPLEYARTKVELLRQIQAASRASAAQQANSLLRRAA